jgi:putative alpha-1,2-mannosidase
MQYNNKPVKNGSISHNDITNGGELILQMSDKPAQ